MPQLLVVVLEHPGQAQRYRQQSGALRLQIETFRIGAPNDARELGQRGISQFVLGEECIKTAEWAVVRQLDTGNVVWNSARFARDALYVVGGNEQEFRFLVDETLDEPGARYPVDLRSLSCNPLHCDLHLGVISCSFASFIISVACRRTQRTDCRIRLSVA